MIFKFNINRYLLDPFNSKDTLSSPGFFELLDLLCNTNEANEKLINVPKFQFSINNFKWIEI